MSSSPVSRLRADGLDTVLPAAHDVDVRVDPDAGLRVVVIEIERVRLRLLEEVDDLAILVRALVGTTRRSPDGEAAGGVTGTRKPAASGRLDHVVRAHTRLADGEP